MTEADGFTPQEREICKTLAAKGLAYHMKALRDAGVPETLTKQRAEQLIETLERIGNTSP